MSIVVKAGEQHYGAQEHDGGGLALALALHVIQYVRQCQLRQGHPRLSYGRGGGTASANR